VAYTPNSTWQNTSTGGTPLSADRLNNMENGIENADNRLTAAESAISGLPTDYPYLSVADYGATGDGTTDDTAALQAAINAAIAAKVALYLPAASVYYRVTSGLVWNDIYPRIFGEGAGRSLIRAATAGFNVLTVGNGTEGGDAHYGYLRDFGIEGATVRPAKIASSSVALLLLNSVKFCSVERMFLDRGDVCVDLKNNCYGTGFLNCWIGRYGESNVGVNLRTGAQSGSDIPFWNCWVGGAEAAFHVSAGFTNLRMYGGQVTMKSSTATYTADNRGVFVLGKDYDTGATGNIGGIVVDGVDVENWYRGWAVRSYGQVNNLVFRGCTFFATATGADAAIGIVKMEAAAQSAVTFEDCEARGTFTAAAVASIAGNNSRFGLFERSWLASSPITVNSVALSAGWMTSLRDQSNLNVSGIAGLFFGSRAQWSIDGLRLRNSTGGSSGVLQKSTDGTTWAAVDVSTPTTLTDGASVAVDASLGKVHGLVAAGNRTILAPTGSPVDGQSLIIRHTASGGARTLTLTTGSSGAFAFGTDITALTATASGTTDYIGCIYSSAAARFHVVSYVKGLT
jgi:hypothetical protein